MLLDLWPKQGAMGRFMHVDKRLSGYLSGAEGGVWRFSLQASPEAVRSSTPREMLLSLMRQIKIDHFSINGSNIPV